MQARMTFTIEPMICLGNYKDKTWPADWAAVTAGGTRSAQFEHTLLVTEDGVEVLTARLADSPGGPIPMPGAEATNGEVNGVGKKARALAVKIQLPSQAFRDKTISSVLKTCES